MALFEHRIPAAGPACRTLTGVTLTSAIADGILAPLGLNSTYVAEAVDTGLVTPGYTRQLSADDRMVDVVPIYHAGWCLTGLMVSTVSDVARFFESLMSKWLLNPGQLAAMTTPVATGGGAGPFFRSPSYGLGLMIDPDWGTAGCSCTAARVRVRIPGRCTCRTSMGGQ